MTVAPSLRQTSLPGIFEVECILPSTGLLVLPVSKYVIRAKTMGLLYLI